MNSTHKELDLEFCSIKPNLYYNYTFPIDLAPNGIPFGAKPLNQSEKCNYNPNLV